MLNGGSYEGLRFWDDVYSTSPIHDYEWISGGLGKLTDGIKELDQGFYTRHEPYVGWERSEFTPDMSFYFGKEVTIDEVRISVDNPKDEENDMDVCRPKRAIIGGDKYVFPTADTRGPYEAVITLDPPIVSEEVRITIMQKCDWVMISEVEFHSADSDNDGVPDNIDKCSATVAESPVRGLDKGKFIFDGKYIVRKKKNGDIVRSSSYTIENMMGCSCEQIVDIMGICSDNVCIKSGCPEKFLNQWITSQTMAPTSLPSKALTDSPTYYPSNDETTAPSNNPTIKPTYTPTKGPTKAPTSTPTGSPTSTPTVVPTVVPSGAPTAIPTTTPTSDPTPYPTSYITESPTHSSTRSPSNHPTLRPTSDLSYRPSIAPSSYPTPVPTIANNMIPLPTGEIVKSSQSPSSPLVCDDICDRSYNPWEEKCTWTSFCDGCHECPKRTVMPSNSLNTKTPTLRPTTQPTESIPRCTNWCYRNGREWEKKCRRKKCQLCYECIGDNEFPSSSPTMTPTSDPTFEPTTAPTDAPTPYPTGDPSYRPSDAPSFGPTPIPTKRIVDNIVLFPSMEIVDKSSPSPSSPLACKTICDLSSNPWEEKCAWSSYCDGCIRCIVTPAEQLTDAPAPKPTTISPTRPIPRCTRGCYNSQKNWEAKCGRKRCALCYECIAMYPSASPTKAAITEGFYY
mmetsp:Transcript_39230/g.47798  ORF Transcript_39230/g.47798 Transcript_39230/m.47798 type:complete len:679 (-) Transcript_39230:563-2599(-)